MIQRSLELERARSNHSADLARGSLRTRHDPKSLLSCLLVLSLLGAVAAPSEAAETDEPLPTPDYRFKQPWVTFGIRGGYVFNRANGEIYDFLTSNLTLDNDDFNGGVGAADIAVRAVSWMDVVLGFEYSYAESSSEFRDFEEDNGDSIEQDTSLTQVPLTASLKFYPLGRGRQVGKYAWIRSRFVPYLGGGLGATWYRLEQRGDFVDFSDLTIFDEKLSTSAWAFSKHAFVGIDVKITRNFGAVLEGRYQWARASVKRDYVGFDRINLDGVRVMAGLSFRL